MTSRDAILSNDYMDLIGKTDTELPLKDSLLDAQCVQRVSPVFSVFYVERERLFGTRMSLPVGDFPGSVCYAPMDTESLEKSGIYAVQRQTALELSGEDVIVGFLDSGISLGAEVSGRTADAAGCSPCGIRLTRAGRRRKALRMGVFTGRRILTGCWRRDGRSCRGRMRPDTAQSWRQSRRDQRSRMRISPGQHRRRRSPL
ncbi:MAG: hypothetical protein LUE31_10635 [Lachnospiraceae bacterium]|nr:hypothetical protein [Lachnospiraceae bacterium]